MAQQASLMTRSYFEFNLQTLLVVTLFACWPVYPRSLATEPAAAPSGNGVIRAKYGSSEIVITTTDRLAGAIHSLKWDGKEFVDSFDHGRQLQSAASFDAGSPQEFWAECFNPTEAGSGADGVGATSSSKLQQFRAASAELTSTVQMAFWLAPGEKSSGRPALNEKVLSDHLVSKRVHIGHANLANVIEYQVTFTVPRGERHRYAQFEALTGYMPAEFRTFRTFQTALGTLENLSDGPGEQQSPIVFATASGSHALGIYSPDQPSSGFDKAGYGRFRFPDEKVVKWNCVFRELNSDGIPAGERRFRMFVVVGTMEQVRQTLVTLVDEFTGRK
jgi:hypothetical protein